MDSAAFKAELRREGYEILQDEARPIAVRELHVHDFDIRMLVLEGSFTLVLGNDRHVQNPGDMCFIPAGALHDECVEAGVMRYIAGTRPARRSD